MRRLFGIFALFIVAALPVIGHAADAPGSTSWTDKIKLSGDFRYRHEFISQETLNAQNEKTRVYDRNRHRLRFRLGLQATVNPNIDVYFRVASSTFSSNTNNPGAGDPISTNQDMSGGFSGKPIWIDRAYLDFHPYKWLNARAGKQPVVFEGTELLWDGDLNPEGISALFTKKVETLDLFVRAGGFWAGERGPSGYAKHALDQGLFGGQVGARGTLDQITAQLALGYFDYGNVKGNPTLYAPNNGFGNSLTRISGRGSDSLGYLFDYNLLDVSGSVKLKTDKVEPTLLFDFVTNTAAEKDTTYNKTLGTSWLAGLSLRFVKLPIDWDFSYNYRDQKKDAVIGAFTDSDPVGGGTNFNGHKLSLGFAVLPSTRLGFTYNRDTRDPDNKDSKRQFGYDRVQGDIEVKF